MNIAYNNDTILKADPVANKWRECRLHCWKLKNTKQFKATKYKLF